MGQLLAVTMTVLYVCLGRVTSRLWSQILALPLSTCVTWTSYLTFLFLSFFVPEKEVLMGFFFAGLQ